MSMWLYQITHDVWPPSRFRIEIWEGERWRWPVGAMVGTEMPAPGDRVVFYYAKTGAAEPGFYGWGVVIESYDKEMYFRPVRPTDELKMYPWWDDEAAELADLIRGKMKQRTLWPIPEDLISRVAAGITWRIGAGGGPETNSDQE